MPILDGGALASELRRAVARRLREVRAARPDTPVPTLGLVAAEVHPDTDRFVALKERAFREAGLAVRVEVLPAEVDTEGVVGALTGLADDPRVHGVFLQYPLPPGVDGAACSRVIPPAKDVDGAGWAAPSVPLAKGAGPGPFAPATAEAVVRLVQAGLRRRPEGEGARAPCVTLVAGDAHIAHAVAALLAGKGMEVRSVAPDAPDLRGVVSGARVLATCAGRPATVDGGWIADGAVVVDAGYHHEDGRGDVHPEPDPDRLAAYVPARGGVGPLTVAILMERVLRLAVSPQAP